MTSQCAVSCRDTSSTALGLVFVSCLASGRDARPELG